MSTTVHTAVDAMAVGPEIILKRFHHDSTNFFFLISFYSVLKSIVNNPVIDLKNAKILVLNMMTDNYNIIPKENCKVFHGTNDHHI